MNKIIVLSKYYIETCNLCISSSFTHQTSRNKLFLHFCLFCLSVCPSVTLADVFLIALQIKELYFLEIAALLT